MKKAQGVLLPLLMFGCAGWLQASEDMTHKVLPGVVHLEGVGTVAVLGVQSDKVGDQDFKVVSGLAFGDVEAGLVNVSEIPLFSGKLSLSTAVVNEVEVDTQYSRGTKTGTQYEQELKGFGQFANLKTHINQQQYWYANLGVSLVSFGDYSLSNGETININDEGLHDVFSTLVSFGLATDERKSFGDNSGLLASIELAGLLFRPGQSDQGQVNYAASYRWAYEGGHSLTAYTKGSHGFVLAEKSEYDEVDEVRAEINGQCDALTDASDKANCSRLELELANYIVDSNKKGNAQALGGAYGLRSFSEQYIKAANTLLQGVEGAIRVPVSMGDGNSFELITFAESAQANDDLAEIFDDSLYSVGLGARLNLKDTPVRLEVAYGGDNTESLILTAGKKW